MARVFYLMWKEFLELRQDPRIFPIVFVAPVLQLTLLGYAATTDVTNVPTAIVDQDRTPASRELIARIEGSPYFSVVSVVGSIGEVDPLLERGEAWLAFAIPSNYGGQVRNGEPVTVQVLADGTDSTSVNVALGYAGNLIAGYAEELVDQPGNKNEEKGLALRVRVWFNPELKSRDFMIPGVLALVLLLMTMILSAMAIVREKELGTLEQLNVTPLRRWELVMGKLMPYAIIGLIDVLLVIAVTIFWFEVPLRGSLTLLLGLSLVYVLNTLGLGLFVSTISHTQQQAMMTAAFFFLMPMVYLSGFIFPIENMPTAIQPITYAIPLRYYLVIVRGIFLKGVGLETLWPQAVALLALGTTIFSLSIMRSTKRAA